MASYNRIIIAGNLTRDPELKQLPSGQSVCRLGLASNRQFKNRQTGTQIQEVCYVDIDVWGPQADSCHKFLQKGRPVLIEGRLKLDTWQDSQGQTRSKHSIVADRVVFLQAGADNGETSEEASSFESSSNTSFSAKQSYGTQETEEFAKAAQAIADKKRQQKPASNDFVDQPPFEDDLPF